MASQRERDGRPLYAYKVRDSEYERLKVEMREQMPRALRGRADRSFAAMFCMYAAETFRRRHAGGPWAWETVFDEIGPTPTYQAIYPWVKQGLQHFKRTLLRSRNGDREFLLTLACEGGLPLRLLHRENAPLSRYFRELLTAYHTQRHTPECDATDIARQVAARYLPASLRHDVVFKLSGDLIQAIVRLQEQEQVADAADPIASLDQAQPGWRDALPLPVEDATVEALLRNLVGQARTLTQTERQRWHWRCCLVCQGESWSISQQLELPSTVTGASLHAWSGWDDPPARLRVLLHTTEGIDVIALLTRLQGTGEQAVYRCEGVRRGGVRLLGKAAMAGTRLLLSRGDAEVELSMVGGQALGPLPWVFAERSAQWEWIGEGSVRSRDAVVRVLALDDGCYMAVVGTCTPLGGAPDLQRVLYEINGTVEWQHPDLGTCQIRCASQDASEENFLLYGKRLSSVLNPHLPFLGMPSLYAMGRDEMPRRVAGATLEWRPLDAPESAWRTDTAACAGKVWVRYRDSDGDLRFRRQTEVLPATARMEMVWVGASAREAGIIRLTGLPAVRVSVPEVTGCRFQSRFVDHGIAIDCFAQAGLPITQFGADLHWPDGRSLQLMLPFPRQGAAFVRAGQVLPAVERVPLDRLAAIQAVVHTPTGGNRFYLDHPLPPLPTTWLHKTATELRSTPNTLCALPIATELNGSSRQFGQRAWQRVCDNVPELHKRLAGEQPLVGLHYSDRYLRSPLTVLLLRELLGALAHYSGGLVTSTRITITTSQLQRNDTQEPRWLYHDWRDATDRQQVFKKVFETLGQFVFDEKRQEYLPHARELHLTWTDGKAWTLRLDQGVGYWRAYNAREPFPFEQSVARQVGRLRSCEIDVAAGYPSYPTYWYVSPA